MGAFVISPLPSRLEDVRCSKAPLLHGCYPLPRYYEPGRRRLVFSRFPGGTGYTAALLPRFLRGTRTVSPVARQVLVTVLPLTTPPECQTASVSARSAMLPSPHPRGLGLRSFFFLSRPPLGSRALRPGDSLTIPRMASSVGFIRFVSFTNATQATEVPDFSSGGTVSR